MRISRLVQLAALALLGGCIIDRSALGGVRDGEDGGSPADAFLVPVTDAPGLDAPGLDAHLEGVDAFEVEMRDASDPLGPDVPIAPIVDAWAPATPDAPPCLGIGTEVCNARDDNCNGEVDEAACGGSMFGVTVSCGAFTHAGHVYQVCKSSPVAVPWDVAQMACASFSPYSLVRVDDNPENSAISSYVREDAWLGLNDRGLEGVFLWADSAPVGYVSWVLGEPTSDRGSSGASEDCVSMRGGSPIWEDRACGVISLTPGTTVSSFVCEAVIVR